MELAGGYRASSWRGVRFFAVEALGESGRRVKVHVYPGSDRSFPEDLGKEPESLRLAVRLIGPDVHEQLETLRKACNEPGPGTLVHPTRGELRMVCLGIQSTTSTGIAGMARATLSFTEAGVETYPVGVASPVAAAAAAADEASALAKVVFLGSILVKGPQFLGSALAKGATSALEALTGVKLAGGTKDGALFQAALANLAVAVQTAASDPDFLGDILDELAGSLFAAAGGNGQALQVLLSLADVTSPAPVATSALGQQAEKNEAAPVVLLGELALAEAVKAASVLEWESLADAEAARDAIAERIDTALEAAGDESFQALRALRARLAYAVPPPSQQLPQVATFTPSSTMPAEVIAYEVYGDASRATELVRRNRVRHPLFVPGAAALEVLVL